MTNTKPELAAQIEAAYTKLDEAYGYVDENDVRHERDEVAIRHWYLVCLELDGAPHLEAPEGL